MAYLNNSAAKKVNDLLKTCDVDDSLHLHLWYMRLIRSRYLDLDLLEGMKVDAQLRAKRADGKRHKSIARSVKDWALKAIEGSAKLAHAYLKKADSTHNDLAEMEEGGQLVFEPARIVQTKHSYWQGFWQRDKDSDSDIEIKLLELQKMSRWHEHRLEPLDEDLFNIAVARLQTNRGRGLDAWAPREVEGLPIQAKQEVFEILKDCEVEGCFPLQVLVNLVALILKPAGGDRPIGLTAWLYCTWAICRNSPSSSWDEKKAGFWDDAIKGSSALQATLLRRTNAEAAASLGLCVVENCWDIEKYYDSIDLLQLIVGMQQLDYPIAVAAMDLLIHVAPRILRWNKLFTEPIGISTSILAGTKFSNRYSRIVIFNMMEELRSRLPSVVSRSFVDDLAQSSYGDWAHVVGGILEAAIVLRDHMERLKLKISPKSTLVTSSRSLSLKLKSLLAAEGIRVSTKVQVHDLGTEATAGVTRGTICRNKRFRKVAARKRKVLRLGRFTTKAKKLYLTNLWPANSFGLEAYGVTKRQLQRMRADAAACVANRSGQCTTTTIAIGLGQKADPAIALRMKIIRSWVDLWFANPSCHKLWFKSWAVLTKKLSCEHRWRKVHGTIGTVICTLLDIGWKPHSPCRWGEPDHLGGTWELREKGEMADLLHEIQNSILSMIWEKASQHHCGAGSQRGVDLTKFNQHIAHLLKKEKFGEAGMLTCIGTGATWMQHRKFQAGLVQSPLCPRCGNEAETDFHRYWSCPDSANIDDPIIEKTEKMGKIAKRYLGRFDCFWLKGLVPNEWLPETAEDDEDNWTYTGQAEQWGPGLYYSDGPGGKSTQRSENQKVCWRCGQAGHH